MPCVLSLTSVQSSSIQPETFMNRYICDICAYTYDPQFGDPAQDIEPGTAFEDLPEDWICPVCGVGKDQFSEE